MSDVINPVPFFCSKIVSHTLMDIIEHELILYTISDPDSTPEQPKIINTSGKIITIKLTPTPNNNGPVSAYRIIVINNNENQGFDKDSLTNYYEAHKNGLAQYIAAEIEPKVYFLMFFHNRIS